MNLSLDQFKKQGNGYLIPEDVLKELIRIYKTYIYLGQMDKRIEDIKNGKDKFIQKKNSWMLLKIKICNLLKL